MNLPHSPSPADPWFVLETSKPNKATYGATRSARTRHPLLFTLMFLLMLLGGVSMTPFDDAPIIEFFVVVVTTVRVFLAIFHQHSPVVIMFAWKTWPLARLIAPTQS